MLGCCIDSQPLWLLWGLRPPLHPPGPWVRSFWLSAESMGDRQGWFVQDPQGLCLETHAIRSGKLSPLLIDFVPSELLVIRAPGGQCWPSRRALWLSDPPFPSFDLVIFQLLFLVDFLDICHHISHF